ncbi:MAG: hypothetical protein KF886_05930 [Candidatus Hydrogenedentes bacterium]|nr:hypothetical protein [Candidatus Hydrogenedentota bacterium]
MSFLLALSALADIPIEIGSGKQLFIDYRFVARSENVSMSMNQAQKLGMIQMEDGSHVAAYPSRAIDAGGRIRLYAGADGVSILESEDGIRFRHTGQSIARGIFTTIFLDEHDPDPSRRYKLFWTLFDEPFDPSEHGVFAAYSADGLDFTDVGQVLPFFIDNPAIVMWDPRIGKYVIYTRAFNYGGENQRQVGRIETDDVLKPWPYIQRAERRDRLSLHDVPVVLSADAEDDPHSDIYFNAAFIYPWAQDVYLMFTSQFRHFSPDRQPFIRPRAEGSWEDYGLLEVQVAVSRDGIHWSRPRREPLFPTGLADEWDRWYAVMGPGVVRRGNYLYQYYTSSGRTHDSVVLRPEYDESPTPGGIGVLRQRLDGYFSMDTDHLGGWLETPPIVFQGNRLRLNIDTGSMGSAFVELRDVDGNPIPGYSLGECEEIGGNFIDQTVYWGGRHDVSALAGMPVRMYIVLVRGKLYAFQFTRD